MIRLGSISIILFTVVPFLSFYSVQATSPENSIIPSVIKIKTYESQNGEFIFSSYGSAVAITPSRVLTNAHVILGSDREPTGLYEVCFSASFERVPNCSHPARLIAYDVAADLAVLDIIESPRLRPLSMSTGTIAIGSVLSMYGYPRIGGETITRTEGQIAGYEQGMYKIDGTIDHGNSGGGAFDSAGNLIGMPTAISADSGVIGYMIPIKRIESFLNRKTSNYELYLNQNDGKFIEFLRKNQQYKQYQLSYRWGGVRLLNPKQYGFRLVGSMISADDRLMIWGFSDEYDRVRWTLSCTDDTGKQLGWQARKAGLVTERRDYPDWDLQEIETDQFYIVYENNKLYTPTATLYYKNYDSCFAEIRYTDNKKDAVSLKNALFLLQSRVSFRDRYELKTRHTNPYFTVLDIPETARVIRSIDTNGNQSIVLGISPKSEVWVHAMIKSSNYDTLGELGKVLQVDFSSLLSDSLVRLRQQSPDTTYSFLDLSEGKRGLIAERYDADKKQMKLSFVYAYRDTMDQYVYWSWTGSYSASGYSDANTMRQVFQSFLYPGKSLF